MGHFVCVMGAFCLCNGAYCLCNGQARKLLHRGKGHNRVVPYRHGRGLEQDHARLHGKKCGLSIGHLRLTGVQNYRVTSTGSALEKKCRAVLLCGVRPPGDVSQSRITELAG